MTEDSSFPLILANNHAIKNKYCDNRIRKKTTKKMPERDASF